MKKSMLTTIAVVFAFAGVAHAGEDTSKSTAKIKAAIEDPSRPETHSERDAGRNPLAVLTFAGIKPGNKVADLAAGQGYYTALLSRVVGDDGSVHAVDPVRVFEAFPNARTTFPAYIESDPRSNVSYTVQKFDELSFPEQLDVVVMGLYYHDTLWTGVDRAVMNKAIYDALKPGGVYLVFDHFALAGADESVTQELHRMVPGVVQPEVEAAGFVFAGESDALANPEDTKDTSVFAEDVRGKTDRFIYLFKKPKR